MKAKTVNTGKRLLQSVVICVLCFQIGITSFAQWTTAGSHIYNSNAGYVGIGTASPSYKFEVSGAAGDVARFIGATSESLRVYLGSGYKIFQTNANDQFGYFNNEFYVTANGGTEAMRVAYTGNVGIGTTSPSYKLDVSGSAGNVARFIGSTNESLRVYLGAGYKIFQTDANDQFGFFNNEFYVTANGGSEAMRIKYTGNVGIGTSSPTERLTVNGNISTNGNISANGNVITRKVIVTQSGWSDYVFDKKYKPIDLSSLETFINQNKRLPEVPSAKEVNERGINVGDNQALLLKKIEELTLYLIDFKKENRRQQKQINELIKTRK